MFASLDEELLHISGSLKPGHTGSARWLDKYSEDVTMDSGVEKRKETEGEGELCTLH
uniref:DNA-directed RNA polymerase I subunit rpa43 n=1 Tax=Rhizophora mucronata TaxID=61149 RepID=A0A2P2L0X7_RHIMU